MRSRRVGGRTLDGLRTGVQEGGPATGFEADAARTMRTRDPVGVVKPSYDTSADGRQTPARPSCHPLEAPSPSPAMPLLADADCDVVGFVHLVPREAPELQVFIPPRLPWWRTSSSPRHRSGDRGDANHEAAALGYRVVSCRQAGWRPSWRRPCALACKHASRLGETAGPP